MNILQAEQISKLYSIDGRDIVVLDNITFNVEYGELLVIQGSSGSGKSTLLSILSGLDAPTSGRVVLDGHEISRLSEEKQAPLRNSTIGFVFQSFHLVPSLSAIENVMFPAELRREPRARELAEELLLRAGLAHRCNNYPHQLSGGEKQRVAICRALINKPKIVFADEPTGNLDSKHGNDVLKLLQELHDEHKTTLILVTHSAEVASVARRILRLHDGRLVEDVRMVEN